MSTSDELQLVNMVELSCDLVTEKPASTTRRDCPSFDIFRITPDQVTESTFVRNLLSTSDNTNLIDCANLRAQATVNTEDLAIHDGSEDEKVENLAARLPDRSIAILLLTLLVETIDLSDLARLMVTTDKGDLLRIPGER